MNGMNDTQSKLQRYLYLFHKCQQLNPAVLSRDRHKKDPKKISKQQTVSKRESHLMRTSKLKICFL